MQPPFADDMALPQALSSHTAEAAGPCVAGLWPMTGHGAGSIEALRRVRPSGPPAALSCNHHVSVR